jgi:hypothetical protein
MAHSPLLALRARRGLSMPLSFFPHIAMREYVAGGMRAL